MGLGKGILYRFIQGFDGIQSDIIEKQIVEIVQEISGFIAGIVRIRNHKNHLTISI